MPIATQPAFTEVEAKLLRLLLCPAAHAGEVDSAGRALIASWRRRGLLAEALLEPRATRQPSSWSVFSPADVIMPFGNIKGYRCASSRRYLRWVLENCDDLQPTRTRNSRGPLRRFAP
jgi:hypothetical protein